MKSGQILDCPGKNFQMRRALGRGAGDAAVTSVLVASARPSRYLSLRLLWVLEEVCFPLSWDSWGCP